MSLNIEVNSKKERLVQYECLEHGDVWKGHTDVPKATYMKLQSVDGTGARAYVDMDVMTGDIYAAYEADKTVTLLSKNATMILSWE